MLRNHAPQDCNCSCLLAASVAFCASGQHFQVRHVLKLHSSRSLLLRQCLVLIVLLHLLALLLDGLLVVPFLWMLKHTWLMFAVHICRTGGLELFVLCCSKAFAPGKLHVSPQSFHPHAHQQ